MVTERGYDYVTICPAYVGMLRLVDGDEDLGPEVRLMCLPGHTPGHQAVRIHSQGDSGYFIGDALHQTGLLYEGRAGQGTAGLGRAVIKNPNFFFLLRTAPEDHQPPTASRQPPTANRHQPLAANRHPPPIATNRQLPPTANHSSILFLWCCVLPMS